MNDNYTLKYYGAVWDDNSLKDIAGRYGIKNCYFGQLWSKFHYYTETQFIFSFAAAKFQHLINFETL